MKRNCTLKMLWGILVATMLLSLTATAQTSGAECSLARATGTYGVSDTGTIVGVGPRAAVARLTLDAAGNINGEVTASLNGTILEGALSGTYTVKSDCTGTTSFSEVDQLGNHIAATASLVWDDNMRQFRFLFTSVTLNETPLAAVVNGDARKMVP